MTGDYPVVASVKGSKLVNVQTGEEWSYQWRNRSGHRSSLGKH